jgi:hypothetical protein
MSEKMKLRRTLLHPLPEIPMADRKPLEPVSYFDLAKAPVDIEGPPNIVSDGSIYPSAGQAQADLAIPDQAELGRYPQPAPSVADAVDELAELRHRRAEAECAIKHLTEYTPEMARLQRVIDECEAQERRLNAGP